MGGASAASSGRADARSLSTPVRNRLSPAPAESAAGRHLHTPARRGAAAQGASFIPAPPLARGTERADDRPPRRKGRSEEHTSELQSLMRTSYAVFCLKKKQHTEDNRKRRFQLITQQTGGTKRSNN